MNCLFLTQLSMVLLAIMAVFALPSVSHSAEIDKPIVDWNKNTHKLTITYRNEDIFSGTVTVRNISGKAISGSDAVVASKETSADAQPVLLEYSHGPKYAQDSAGNLKAHTFTITIGASKADLQISLDGSVQGKDSFTCRTDGAEGIVRGASGHVSNSINNGVYDRGNDWALSISESGKYSIKYLKSTGINSFLSLKASGKHITLVFQPDFYKVHRGFFDWKPVRSLWKAPVSGWCSWAAFGQEVNEEQVVKAADFFSKELLPYGYDIIQIDDGYQIFNQNEPKPLLPGQSTADLWSNSNNHFPNGMKAVAEEIKKRKMVPGIWISSALPLGLPEDWYVKDRDNQIYKGMWVDYAINGLIEPAVDQTFKKTIHDMKAQGWDYFKIDTIRHVLYDSYRRVPEYWQKRNEDHVKAFRSIYRGISDEIGPNIYMLACWGTIPEMAGLADGCRIGEDVGPSWGSVMQVNRNTCKFNFLNNVIWRNDPDYMCFRLPVEQARSWASMIALTGMQLMVSDPVEDYDESRLDILRKVGPALYVRPQTLHPMQPNTELWQLDINFQNEPYTVLGRIAWNDEGLGSREIHFSELGLDAGKNYLVWDFWNEKFIGNLKGSFSSEKLNVGECRVYAIRPALNRPQIISTNRHISQGAQELEKVVWKNGNLSGRIKIPEGRTNSIYIYVPEGYAYTGTSRNSVQQNGHIIKLTVNGIDGKPIKWSLSFTNKTSR